MPERTLMRVGAISAVIGAIVFAVANMLHARASDIEETAEQVKAVVDSDIWIADHLILLIGVILVIGGLVALQRSITGERAGALARLGYVGALMSGGLTAVIVGIDGRASKVIYDAWAAAPPEEAATALRIAVAIEELDFGMFSILIMLFFGMTYTLYGLSVAMSENYPKWLGWVAVVVGAVSFAVGAAINLGGPSALVINIFVGASSLLVVWTIVMGILMWRRSGITQ